MSTPALNLELTTTSEIARSGRLHIAQRQRDQNKAVKSDTVELGKIRRELLTLVSRIDKLIEGQETA